MANPPAGITFSDTPQPVPAAPPTGVTFSDTPQPAEDSSTSPVPKSGLMGNIVEGFLQSAGETVQGGAKLLEKGANAIGGEDRQVVPAMQTPPVKGYSVPLRTDAQGAKVGDQGSIGHTIGEGIEQVGEFATGEGLVSDFAKALTKYPEIISLMERYPKASKLLLEASKAETESKAAKIGAATAKGAVVGGAQGAVKGAAQGEGAAGGAEGGAEGGAIGGAAGESAGIILGDILKQFGVGTTAGQKGLQSLKPAKGNTRFLSDFQRAAPVIDANPEWKDAKDAQEGVDAIRTARQNWWAQEVQPWVDKHANVPLSGLAIKNSISAEIPDTMKELEPQDAAEIERFATQFMPGQVFRLSVKDAESKLQFYNQKLAATGFWKKDIQERTALENTDPTVIKWKGAADAIREELYNRLGILEPGLDMAEKKQTYGALRNVENQLQGRVNVEGRQAPISLKQAIGLTAGLSMGRLEGLAAVALPMVDRNYNSAINLAKRGVKQAATGDEGALAKTAKIAAEGLPAVTAPAGAAAGRIAFRASDGSYHSVPADQLHAATVVDPHLEVLNK